MSTLEPNDVGPAVGGHLRASDADRNQVATLLNAAYAEGRLTRDEHDQRLQQAMDAQVFDDLVPLTRDLVALDTPPAAATWQAPPVPVGSTSEGPDLIFTIFSGTSRKGNWLARRHISVMNLFGGTDLDFTQAQFADSVVEISVFCLFGGVDVIVPEGVDVQNSVVAIFGGADSTRIAPRPGAPRIVIKGFVGFGGVDARVPKRKK